MKQLTIMIKPASSLCNMRCKYCFYSDISRLREFPSYGIMSSETRQKMLQHIFSGLADGDSVSFAFQGGEPALAGLSWYQQFIGEVKKLASPGIHISYQFQTNGLLLDEEWLCFFKEHRFLIGLSLDGPRDIHDRSRPDAHGKGTFTRVLETKTRLEQYHIPCNILIVLTNSTARHPKQIWNFLKKHQISHTQLIPCLAPLNQDPDAYSLTPRRYASFYTALFNEWYEDACQGNFRSIKLFDDLLNLLAFHQETACGITGRCQGQIVTEANGNVYPCDFYALDEWLAGNFQIDDLRFLYESPVQTSFCSRPRQLPSLCGDCPYFSICGGGCPRMRSEVFCDPKDGFCGHRAFLDGSLPRILRLAERLHR